MNGRPVLWVDPGKMTGLASWAPGRDPLIHELAFQEAGDLLDRYCSFWNRALLIGWERFTITPQTHKKTAEGAHEAIEMIGLCRFFARRHGCTILVPAQPDQRKVATRQMLAAIGWWRPGQDDSQSAAQHLLAWMLRENCVPLRESGILTGLRSRSGEQDADLPDSPGDPHRHH